MRLLRAPAVSSGNCPGTCAPLLLFLGLQVHLCGSFTRWVETVPMAPVDGSPGVFAVVVHLPPG